MDQKQWNWIIPKTGVKSYNCRMVFLQDSTPVFKDRGFPFFKVFFTQGVFVKWVGASA